MSAFCLSSVLQVGSHPGMSLAEKVEGVFSMADQSGVYRM